MVIQYYFIYAAAQVVQHWLLGSSLSWRLCPSDMPLSMWVFVLFCFFVFFCTFFLLLGGAWAHLVYFLPLPSLSHLHLQECTSFRNAFFFFLEDVLVLVFCFSCAQKLSLLPSQYVGPEVQALEKVLRFYTE